MELFHHKVTKVDNALRSIRQTVPRDYSLLSTDGRRNIYIVVSCKFPWFFAVFRLLPSPLGVSGDFASGHFVEIDNRKREEGIGENDSSND